MIPPDKLYETLTVTANLLRKHGERTWQRIEDWSHVRPITGDERGGGVGTGGSDHRIADEKLDRQAAAYKAELRTLTDRLDADLHRLRRLIDITHPARPDSQDPCCRSCARDGGREEPVHDGRYRTACRFCGEWRAAHGDWPPLAVLRWHHANPGRKIPVHVVEAAS